MQALSQAWDVAVSKSCVCMPCSQERPGSERKVLQIPHGGKAMRLADGDEHRQDAEEDRSPVRKTLQGTVWGWHLPESSATLWRNLNQGREQGGGVPG